MTIWSPLWRMPGSLAQCSIGQIILKSNILRHYFYLPKVIIQVLNGNGVLNKPVPDMYQMHGTILMTTPGHFALLLLP